MKITVYAMTNRVGSRNETEIEVPDEDLEGMDEDEQARTLEAIAKEAMWEMIEWGWDKT
jgi:hypothetical protein